MADRRAGGRSALRAERTVSKVDMLPTLRRNLPLCDLMDAEHVQRIDEASMDILEEVGVIFRGPIALTVWPTDPGDEAQASKTAAHSYKSD